MTMRILLLESFTESQSRK